MDDLSLLRDYADTGSSRAFALLVERHVDLVHSAALRRVHGDPHRAAEVTQMVFVDLARKASRLTRHPVLAGWLHQSTRWAAATALRAERRRRIYEQAAAGALHEMNTASEPSTDWETLRPLLDSALDQLRDNDRETVLLRFFANLSFAEVAARLGVSENAARMRVERALEKLHRALRRRGVSSSAIALGLAMSKHAVTAAPVEFTATLAPTSISAAAATAATGGFWTAALNFIMTKAQLGLVAIALGLALGLSLEVRHRATAREALNQIRAQETVHRTEIARLSARVAAERLALENLPAVDNLAPPDPVQLERKRLDVLIRKGELDHEYADLFRHLKLDPVTLDTFKSMLVERNQAIYDAQQVAKQEAVEIASWTEFQELQREATRAADRQIMALLGAEKFSYFNHYVATMDERSLVSYAAAAGGDSGYEERTDALITLFEKTCPDYFAKTWDRDEPQPQPLPDAFLAQAKPLLTDEAYVRLTSLGKISAARTRMSEIAREAAYQGKLKLSKSSARLYTPAKIDSESSGTSTSSVIRIPAP